MDKNNHYCVHGCLYCMVTGLYEHIEFLQKDNQALAKNYLTIKYEKEEMDRKIKSIEKKEKQALKGTKELLKMDRKQDKKLDKMKKGKC